MWSVSSHSLTSSFSGQSSVVIKVNPESFLGAAKSILGTLSKEKSFCNNKTTISINLVILYLLVYF